MINPEENDSSIEIMEKFYSGRRYNFNITVTTDPITQDAKYLVSGVKNEVVTYSGIPKSYTCTCRNFDKTSVTCVHISRIHQMWRTSEDNLGVTNEKH